MFSSSNGECVNAWVWSLFLNLLQEDRGEWLNRHFWEGSVKENAVWKLDARVGECVWYWSKNHKCFHLLFVGKEKKIGVFANSYANCHLFFKTIRNAKVYGFWMLPIQKGAYTCCVVSWWMLPLRKLKARLLFLINCSY